MKKLLLLGILLMISKSMYSQNVGYKVIYKLDYRLNLKSEKPFREYFYLRTKGNSSIFEGRNKMVRDTIFKDISNGSRSISELKNTPKTYFLSQIVKKDNKLIYNDEIFIKGFTYTEDVPNQWRLINESKKIKGYNCQKAIMDYGGRSWIAWYTLELPIQHGPYKFTGLPGLIVKVHDSQNHYEFELYSSEKKDKISISPYYAATDFNLNKVTRSEFIETRMKAYSSYQNKLKIMGAGLANPEGFLDPLRERQVNKSMRKLRNFLELE